MEKAITALLHAEHIRQAAQCWQAEMKSLQFIDASANFVYAFEHEGRSLILRLTHSSHRHIDLVKGEVDWMRYLSENGVNVCMPVPSVHNQLVELVPAHGTYFIATVFERAKGKRATAGDPQVWNANLFTKWGQTIGQMDAVRKHYQIPDPAMKRPKWHEEELLLNARDYLPSSEKAVLNLVDRVWIGYRGCREMRIAMVSSIQICIIGTSSFMREISPFSILMIVRVTGLYMISLFPSIIHSLKYHSVK